MFLSQGKIIVAFSTIPAIIEQNEDVTQCEACAR